MTIITQENDLINYDHIKRISIFEGEYDDKEAGEKREVYSIVAFDLNSDVSTAADEVDFEDTIHLGVFETSEEATEVLEELKKSIASGLHIFCIPQPVSI